MERAAKSRRLKEYYARHGRIFIVVDATREDVIVPEHLSGDPALKLVLNVRMPQAICFHSNYLESNFSFSGQSRACHIPISAIWAAYLPDGEVDGGILWEQDMPVSVQAAFTAARKMDGEARPDQPAPSSGQEESAASSEPLQRQGRSHLRVVK